MKKKQTPDRAFAFCILRGKGGKARNEMDGKKYVVFVPICYCRDFSSKVAR